MLSIEVIVLIGSLNTTISLDNVSNKSLKLLEQPKIYERQQWLNNLGYCQWREDEIERGLPWHHLKQKYV